MTLPSSSTVRRVVFRVKRSKRAREEEEEEQPEEQSQGQVQQSSSHIRTSSQENQTNSHEQQKMSPVKMAQKLLDYQNKVRSCKRLLVTLKREKERDLTCLVDQLALLENRLRREQRDIQEQLGQRDMLVQAQRLEIERLYRDNERLSRDNRRLAHKVKKSATTVRDKDHEKGEKRVKFSVLESIEDENTCNSCDNISNHSFDIESINETGAIPISINCSICQYYAGSTSSHVAYYHYQSSGSSKRYSYPITESINHNLPGYKLNPDRVLHKPPIAEKPKGLSQNLFNRNPSYSILNAERSSVLESSNVKSEGNESEGFCTTEVLPKNIGLMDEETDDTSTAGSSTSEHSSPESTLKTVTFKTILKTRHFKEPLDPTRSSSISDLNHHSPRSDSFLDLHTSEVSNVKSYIMDEYEVTSGYNSDAVSDPDYENIRFGTLVESYKDEDEQETKESTNTRILSEKEDESNSSVICKTIGTEQSLVDLTNEDHNIYSNVEFGAALKTDEGEVKEEEDITEQSRDDSQDTTKITDQLDEHFSSTASDDSEVTKIVESNNSPRSHQSITHLTDRDHMTSNFEEFKLDTLELEKDENLEICTESISMMSNEEKRSVETESNAELEKEKENLPVIKNERVVVGYENIMQPPMSPVGGGGEQYQKFLEATGLSQKSILTPTRTLINHRSVLKPCDVKHRNKLLRNSFSALSTVQEAPQTQPRHYTQPYI